MEVLGSLMFFKHGNTWNKNSYYSLCPWRVCTISFFVRPQIMNISIVETFFSLIGETHSPLVILKKLSLSISLLLYLYQNTFLKYSYVEYYKSCSLLKWFLRLLMFSNAETHEKNYMYKLVLVHHWDWLMSGYFTCHMVYFIVFVAECSNHTLSYGSIVSCVVWLVPCFVDQWYYGSFLMWLWFLDWWRCASIDWH